MARGDGLLVYRNGTREKIDMEISDGGRKNNKFYFSYRPYAGGGEAHIKFSNNGYRYYIYDKIIKADDGHDFSAGIVVYRGDKKVANLGCINNASIRQQAYSSITRESYRNIDTE
ncbi:hypothetical protein HpMS107_37360 [Helicobacter pylori]